MQDAADGALSEMQRFWLEHLRAWKQSGKSLRLSRAEHGLDGHSAQYFKGVLRRQGLLATRRASSPPHFVRAQVPAVEPAMMGTCRVHLPNGAIVEFACAATGEALQAVVEAARALS